jgi:hypothetical protein
MATKTRSSNRGRQSGRPKLDMEGAMKTGVATKSSRVKSARGRARRGSANEVSPDNVKAALIESLKHDGAAVQSLDHLIARTEQENRAWRGTAEKKSQHPHPKGLAAFRCQDCDARFLADRVFDVARKAEVALLAAGLRTELTPADDIMAESFEAPRKWKRCPECASSNICYIQEQSEEAGSIETVTDVAGMLMDDIRSTLPKFEGSAEARIECMDVLWALCATLSRGCELAREADKLSELVREFGLKEATAAFGRWIEEKKTRPPGQL